MFKTKSPAKLTLCCSLLDYYWMVCSEPSGNWGKLSKPFDDYRAKHSSSDVLSRVPLILIVVYDSKQDNIILNIE